jgi:hypothetical protein
VDQSQSPIHSPSSKRKRKWREERKEEIGERGRRREGERSVIRLSLGATGSPTLGSPSKCESRRRSGTIDHSTVNSPSAKRKRKWREEGGGGRGGEKGGEKRGREEGGEKRRMS